MNIYERFAYFYARGPYSQYSKKMVEILPIVFERFGVEPMSILDLTCGEGAFAVMMAKRGFQVTGVDLSQQMLQFARERAEKEKVKVKFICQDMRVLSLEEKFDFVTCWYDSLNYLLELKDLERTFANVCRVLNRDGLFVFDMNTIYGLAVNWQRYPCYVQQDTPELFEVCRPSYDFEKNIATLTITGFIKKKGRWVRVDEEHKKRGYSLEEIRQCLRRAGLRELACWGSLQKMSEVMPNSGRVWFVVTK